MQEIKLYHFAWKHTVGHNETIRDIAVRYRTLPASIILANKGNEIQLLLRHHIYIPGALGL